jgi:GNAT superfamily N-acetyltransferase
VSRELRVVREAAGAEALAGYASVPIAFEVRSVFDVVEEGGGFVLKERAVAPYHKDYDAVPGERPTDWPAHFDLSWWALFVASDGGRRVGGAAVAIRTPGLEMLEGRDDLAVLWDLRVDPVARGRGVGAALFGAAAAWARGEGCRELKVETQDTNVPACRFYAACGCRLAGARRGAYPALPHEVQLIWRRALG